MRWVNVNFQGKSDNRQAKHFANNFITKNVGDILDFTTRLIDNNNKEIEFETDEKKFPIVNILIEFLA